MNGFNSCPERVEDALRASLYEQKPLNPAQVSEPWPVYGTGGLQPGLDLRDNAGLLDRMVAIG
ncbi:MAG: hypothetical protein LAT83_21945 [Kiritimatiellae bacterium]|nr:hypothetical protein [Kiritimatiellia bacterium]